MGAEELPAPAAGREARSGPLRAPVDREAEADEPNVDATVWLYRELPDPTPASRRLKPAFAQKLKRSRRGTALTGR